MVRGDDVVGRTHPSFIFYLVCWFLLAPEQATNKTCRRSNYSFCGLEAIHDSLIRDSAPDTRHKQTHLPPVISDSFSPCSCNKQATSDM